ncbi:MAG: hypothetical protein JNG84_00875 [Archangium sp.]|nr:hypothetical protein [Archangium sp.]
MSRPMALAACLTLSCARAPVVALAPDDVCTGTTPLKPGAPGSPDNLIPSSVNPNGVSELSALMRVFVDDMRAARTAVERGAPVPPMWARHRKVRCAWPSELSDHTPSFDAKAVLYLDELKNLESNPADPRQAYESVRVGCVTCHEETCEAQMDLVDSLSLSASAR